MIKSRLSRCGAHRQAAVASPGRLSVPQAGLRAAGTTLDRLPAPRHAQAAGASGARRAGTCGAAAAEVAPMTAPAAPLAPLRATKPAAPGPLEQLPMGVTLYADGTASFRVWAPHAQAVALEVRASGSGDANAAAVATTSYGLARIGDTWAALLPAGALRGGTAYQVLITAGDGSQLLRRDPYARHTDFDSSWCFVDDATQYNWSEASDRWTPPDFDTYIIYEMHVGSFTPEGTFAAAAARLAHVASLGFTAVQLMPIAEHSDRWGYNPRQFCAVHQSYGSPDDLRRFVDAAHGAGLAVIVDVVLNHLAVDGNCLWEYDGWGPYANGGIFHEGARDTPWGRGPALWKGEVLDYATAACMSYLADFRADGLRFDSANDLPRDAVQALTWRLRDAAPGRLLSAEVTPEDPRSVHELGFDSVWVHSGYFDIIQQHRALGRGHHGGGDWAEGWNLPRLRTVLCLHYGFTSPQQCVKYVLGSHDQVGCANGGGHYEDYKLVGGRHRYAVDQLGGGRTDPAARAAARCWHAANVGAAGLVMVFMGTEWAQGGWWDTTPERRLQWDQAGDEIGLQFSAAVRDANALRAQYPALRRGWANVMHEDRPNGVMAAERVGEGLQRMLVVVNAGRGSWSGPTKYGLWVGGGAFEEVYCSQDAKYGGYDKAESNGDKGVLQSHDGRLWISLPPTCTLIFRAVA